MRFSQGMMIVGAALLLAPGAQAKKDKDKDNATSGLNTAAGTGVADWLTPQAEDGLYIRVGFDTDPSAYVGRFIKEGTEDISESSAMELTCSEYITTKVVGGGGVQYDEYFQASTSAAARLSIPPALRAAAGTGQSTLVRVRYTLTNKMQYEIADASGFEACCKAAPGQCTDLYIGEFLEGRDGQIFYSVGTESELVAQGISPAAVGGLEMKDGRYWRSSLAFPNPVYFAFKTTDNIHIGGSSGVGLTSGACTELDWDDIPPQSSQGQYFVGVSQPYDSEQAAREDAMLNARKQAVEWLATALETGTVKTSSAAGSGAGLKSAISEEKVLEAAAGGVASFVKDQAWCTNHKQSIDGPSYMMKAAAFLPASEYTAAAEEALGASE
jgi:hypothetical protein